MRTTWNNPQRKGTAAAKNLVGMVASSKPSEFKGTILVFFLLPFAYAKVLQHVCPSLRQHARRPRFPMGEAPHSTKARNIGPKCFLWMCPSTAGEGNHKRWLSSFPAENQQEDSLTILPSSKSAPKGKQSQLLDLTYGNSNKKQSSR